jgi:hypothetical protein
MASLIDAPRGADLLLSYIFPEGTDLGGYGAAFTVYGERNGMVLFSAGMTATANGSALSAIGNLLALTMRAADIDALPVNSEDATLPAIFWFDLIVTTPTPDVCKLYGGLMRVMPYGAQVTPEGGFIDVALGGQSVTVEVTRSGFDTAVLALAEGYATDAQVAAAASTVSATDSASSATESAASATNASTVAANAAGSATTAGTYASEAAISASGATTSAMAAASSATSADAFMSSANIFAVGAAGSATTARGLVAGAATVTARPLADGYIGHIFDANYDVAFGVKSTGQTFIANPLFPDGVIPSVALSLDTQARIPPIGVITQYSDATGWAFPFYDKDGHIAGGWLTNGSFKFINAPILPGASITYTYLDATITSLFPPIAAITKYTDAAGWAFPFYDSGNHIAGGWLKTGQFQLLCIFKFTPPRLRYANGRRSLLTTVDRGIMHRISSASSLTRTAIAKSVSVKRPLEIPSGSRAETATEPIRS